MKNELFQSLKTKNELFKGLRTKTKLYAKFMDENNILPCCMSQLTSVKSKWRKSYLPILIACMKMKS
jgi:hypothetical protein